MTRKAMLFALALGGTAFASLDAQTIARIEPFLDARDREIALAESAGPPEVGARATILVLTRDGYEKAREGDNGFVCMVWRSWAIPPAGPDAAFTDATGRIPHCLNAEAVRSVLPVYKLQTEMVLQGRSRSEINRAVEDGFASGRFGAPHGLAMAYMLSEGQQLPGVGQWRPHVMFYVGGVTNAELGGLQFGGEQPFVQPTSVGTPHATIVVPVEHFVPVRSGS